MARLYVFGSSKSSYVINTKSLGSVEFTLWREVARIYSGSRLVLGAFS